MPRPACQSPEKQQESDALGGEGEEGEDEVLLRMQGWGGGEGLPAALCRAHPLLSEGQAGEAQRFPCKGTVLPTARRDFPCNSPTDFRASGASEALARRRMSCTGLCREGLAFLLLAAPTVPEGWTTRGCRQASEEPCGNVAPPITQPKNTH